MYIPEDHYVGLQLRQENHVKDEHGQWVGTDVMLGFATPVADDKAYEKRKATVDSWANNYQNTMTKDDPRRIGQVYPNKLAHGFEIAKSVRRSGWNGGNVVWRIVDPRGFELEISSANLASILDCSTIVDGVIQEPCIWGRDGANNILLPEDSEPYQEFVKLTQLKDQAESKAVSVKDLKPGNIITLVSGEVVEYMGKFYCVKHEYLDGMDPTERRRGAGSSWNKVVERYAYQTSNMDKWNSTGIELVSRLKVANVVNAKRTSNIDSYAWKINDMECSKKFGDYIYVTPYKLTSSDIHLTVEEADPTEAIAAVTIKDRDREYVPAPFYFGQNQRQDKLVVGNNWSGRITSVPFTLYNDGAYTIAARDLSYSSVSGLSPESLIELKWFKIVMHYGGHTTDKVRF